MKVFKPMIVFGGIILIGGFLSFLAFGMGSFCDDKMFDGKLTDNCPQPQVPWKFIGLYLLPGIILIGSGIFLKMKNR